MNKVAKENRQMEEKKVLKGHRAKLKSHRKIQKKVKLTMAKRARFLKKGKRRRKLRRNPCLRKGSGIQSKADGTSSLAGAVRKLLQSKVREGNLLQRKEQSRRELRKKEP